MPALLAFFSALANISDDASMPETVPVGPTWRLAAIASVPVPQPTSRTEWPGSRCAQAENPLTESSLAPEGEQPHQEIVVGGRMKNQTGRIPFGIPAFDGTHIILLAPATWPLGATFHSRTNVLKWTVVHFDLTLAEGRAEERRTPLCAVMDNDASAVRHLLARRQRRGHEVAG